MQSPQLLAVALLMISSTAITTKIFRVSFASSSNLARSRKSSSLNCSNSSDKTLRQLLPLRNPRYACGRYLLSFAAPGAVYPDRSRPIKSPVKGRTGGCRLSIYCLLSCQLQHLHGDPATGIAIFTGYANKSGIEQVVHNPRNVAYWQFQRLNEISAGVGAGRVFKEEFAGFPHFGFVQLLNSCDFTKPGVGEIHIFRLIFPDL